MPSIRPIPSVLALVLALLLAAGAGAEIGTLETGGFTLDHEVVLPGTPDAIYDALTGDISGWWDHSFSEHPLRFYIDPKPGGGFYEIFDESGDGVLHATVTFAKRGEWLRFHGPLGLSGYAVDMYHSYRLEPVGEDSTKFHLSVRAVGEENEKWASVVDQVWRHFLFERFVPYVEGGFKPLD